MASKLYIGGLSYSTTSDGLREFFAQSGNVLSATVITGMPSAAVASLLARSWLRAVTTTLGSASGAGNAWSRGATPRVT